jgi:uncharacterized protein (TIGR03067 family)
MAISVQCQNPECGKTCRVKDESAGKAVKCPGCGQRIIVPPGKPIALGSQPVTKPEPRVKTPAAPPIPERPRRQAAWPWLLGMAAMLLVGAGGGYFVTASRAQKGEERPGHTGADDSELRKVQAELQVAQAELAKLRTGGPPPTSSDDSELRKVRADLQAAQAEAATAKAELARLRTSASPPTPTPGVADGQRDAENVRGVWKAVDENAFPFDKPITIASYQDKSVFDVLGLTMSYKLDPTQTPKTIDLINEREGRTYTGIYELNGDLLNIAVHLDGKSRPRDYVLSPQDKENDQKGKSSKWVFLLRRQSR